VGGQRQALIDGTAKGEAEKAINICCHQEKELCNRK
jgi:hypothetical protein